MGEMVENMMLGIFCEACGTFIDDEAPGHPRLCEGCEEVDADE